MKTLLLFGLLIITLVSQGQEVIDTLKISEVEIISTYRPTERTPVTECVVDKKTIKENSFTQELPVFLSSTPSITSCSDGGHQSGYTYMRMRGIDQTRINFTLNGVQMNECEDQGFYSSNFPDFLSSLNSIEIMRGVGSTTYGMASYVGSINFESVNLQDKRQTTFSNTYGSFNTYKSTIELNTGILPDNFAFYSRASITGSDGYRDHSGNRGYSYFFSGGYFGKSHIVKTNAFIGNSCNRMAWLGSSQADIDTYGTTYNPNSANEWDNFTQAFVQIQDYYRLNTNSSITSGVFYNRLDGNWDLDTRNTFGDPMGSTINYQLYSNFTGVVVNYKYVTEFLRFNTGVNGNYYERNHALADKSAPSMLFYSNKGIKNSGSVYGKLEYDLRCLTIYTDLQYRVASFDYVKDKIDPNSAGMNTKTWDFLSPKLGMTHCLTKNIKSYLSVGQSRREPTRTDMFGGEDNLFYIDNTHINTNYVDVKPENVVDYEGGMKFIYTKFKANINLFYMDFMNEITLKGAVGANSLPIMVNVDKSYRSGAELEASGEYKGFTFTNSTSYMHSEIKSDGKKFKPVMTPDFIINQSVAYTYKMVTLGVAAHYTSERYLDLENLNKLKPNYGFDATVMVKYREHDVMLGVYNLTGKANGSDIAYGNGVIGPDGLPRYFVDAPINFYVTLHIKL